MEDGRTQTYWLTDRQTGEMTLVDGDTVERLLGVELGYVKWCIRVYLFSNYTILPSPCEIVLQGHRPKRPYKTLYPQEGVEFPAQTLEVIVF